MFFPETQCLSPLLHYITRGMSVTMGNHVLKTRLRRCDVSEPIRLVAHCAFNSTEAYVGSPRQAIASSI